MRRNSRGGSPVGTHNRGGPGLLRTMGRTAVIAGTATAVSNKVSAAQHASAQQQAAAQQQRVAQEQQRIDNAVQQALAQQPAAPPAAPAGLGGAERVALLQQLAELKNQGILTDAEFAAEKARIMAS